LSTTITDLVTHLDPGKKPPMSGLNYGEFKRFADSLQKISTRVDRNAFADAVKLGPKFADWLSKNENAIPNGTRLLKHETAELIKALNGAKPILAKLNNLDAFAGYRSASSTPRLQSTKQTVKLQQELRVVATQLRRPMKFVGIKYPPKVIQDFDVK
jgi:hypothetical protein